MICKIRFLLLLRTSNSMKIICCQVPRVNLPLANGTVRLGPIREALTCECPLPSCHLFSCSYIKSFGAMRSSISGRSFNSPGSYSIVVNAPVDPGTKIVTIPLLNLVSTTASATALVTSKISPSPLVWIESCFVFTVNSKTS
jgi:hypothetical protein